MTKGTLCADLLLQAYASGVFPMANSKEDASVFWVEPENRGILPLDAFHIPHSLRRVLRKGTFEVSFNRNFRAVIEGCADRPETWINGQILDACIRLHEMGFAHSVECYRNGHLAGGLYGISLRAAFFGESMFSRETNASKVALCALVEHLNRQGFLLLDTQFITSHLSRFGAVEIPQKEYLKLLKNALYTKALF